MLGRARVLHLRGEEQDQAREQRKEIQRRCEPILVGVGSDTRIEAIYEARRERVRALKKALEKCDYYAAELLLREISQMCTMLGEYQLAIDFTNQANLIEHKMNKTELVKDITACAGKKKKKREEIQLNKPNINRVTSESPYKKYLVDLQERALKTYAEGRYGETRRIIKQMIAIVEHIGDPVLKNNYKANLKKINLMEKRANRMNLT
ncbi:MAG: hypothetical protein ACFFCS_03000 [Candidatus Hodarchaeota archaeon]